jgi:hypothetical protein
VGSDQITVSRSSLGSWTAGEVLFIPLRSGLAARWHGSCYWGCLLRTKTLTAVSKVWGCNEFLMHSLPLCRLPYGLLLRFHVCPPYYNSKSTEIKFPFQGMYKLGVLYSSNWLKPYLSPLPYLWPHSWCMSPRTKVADRNRWLKIYRILPNWLIESITLVFGEIHFSKWKRHERLLLLPAYWVLWIACLTSHWIVS